MFRVVCVICRGFGVAVLLSTLGLAGCGDDGDDDDGGGGDPSGEDGVFECHGSSGPALACCDVMQAFLDTCIRCEVGSPRLCEFAVNDQLALASFGQGCEGTDRIRDEMELYEECLPTFPTLSCDDFRAGTVPPSCADQLLYEIG